MKKSPVDRGDFKLTDVLLKTGFAVIINLEDPATCVTGSSLYDNSTKQNIVKDDCSKRNGLKKEPTIVNETKMSAYAKMSSSGLFNFDDFYRRGQ